MDDNFKHWINFSLKAPSGDNCQAWEFDFYNSYFTISIEKNRAKHFLDQEHFASWISIGCLYENLVRCSEHFGFKCHGEISSNSMLKVNYSECPQINNQDIQETIKNRITFRGKLSKSVFDLNDYKEVSNQAELKWSKADCISDELIKYWSELETIVWLKTSLMKDFTKWIRWPAFSVPKDGVTISNLKLNIFESFSIIVFKHLPILIKTVPKFIFYQITKKRLNFLLQNASGVLILHGNPSKQVDYFHIGREIQSMWLYLTKKGLKAQPLSIQSLFFNYLSFSDVTKNFTTSELTIINNIKTKTFVELDIKKNILFMFRFGSSEEIVQPTSRRSFGTKGLNS